MDFRARLSGLPTEEIKEFRQNRYGAPDEKLRPELTQQPRPAEIPLSYAQERLWFLEQLQLVRSAYRVTGVLQPGQALDREVLERSFEKIVQRHEILRTHFDERDGRPFQL